MKENLAVIFGGVSVEHDISIVSAMQAINYIDKSFYNVIPIYISKNGNWYTSDKLCDISSFANLDTNKLSQVSLYMGSNFLYKKSILGYKKHMVIDCAFVVMHGANGEDGKVMSVLDLCNIPYTSAKPVESGLCIDKSIFKTYLKGLGVRCVNGITINDTEYYSNSKNALNLAKKLGFPVITKPATLGSSIGICVCNNIQELVDAISLGFTMSSKVLVEKFIDNIVEINVAIVKDGNNLIVSELEQPIKSNQILSFENKYLNNSKSMASVSRVIPAEVEDSIKEEIIRIAKNVYSNINLKGVVRFDFILSEGKVYLNEVNTIPGSLAYYLFEPKGIKYNELINILIKNAYADYEIDKNKTYTFDSGILNGDMLSIKK